MLLDAAKSLLLLVDHQQRLMPAIHEGEAVIANALRLAQLARALGIPIVGTEQSPRSLGPIVATLRELCDEVLEKTRFDGCADGLIARLQPHAAAGRTQLVVAGCEAHVCLMQTSLGLLDAAQTIWLVRDACGSRAASNQAAAMHRIERAGATLVTTEMVGFEWVRHAGHEQFRLLQKLVR
jgi:nicotinamidase-related amidase